MANDVKGGRRRAGRRVVGAWIVSLVVLGGVAALVLRAGDAQAFVEHLTHADPRWLVVGAALQGVAFVCLGVMWGNVLACAGHPVSLPRLVRLAVAKVVTDQVFPTGGIGGSVLVVRALEERDVPRGPATAPIVVDLVSRYGAYAVMLGLSMGPLAEAGALQPAVLTLTCAFLALTVTVPALLLWLNRREPGTVPWGLRRVPGVRAAVAAVSDAPTHIVRDRGLLVKAMALRTCFFLCQATTLGAMLAAIGRPTPAVTILVAFLLASVAEMVAVMPGGLGTYEGASVGILHLFDVPVATGLAAVLLYRGLSFWLPIPFGLWFARRAIADRPLAGG